MNTNTHSFETLVSFTNAQTGEAYTQVHVVFAKDAEEATYLARVWAEGGSDWEGYYGPPCVLSVAQLP